MPKLCGLSRRQRRRQKRLDKLRLRKNDLSTVLCPLERLRSCPFTLSIDTNFFQQTATLALTQSMGFYVQRCLFAEMKSKAQRKEDSTTRSAGSRPKRQRGQCCWAGGKEGHSRWLVKRHCQPTKKSVVPLLPRQKPW